MLNFWHNLSALPLQSTSGLLRPSKRRATSRMSRSALVPLWLEGAAYRGALPSVTDKP